MKAPAPSILRIFSLALRSAPAAAEAARLPSGNLAAFLEVGRGLCRSGQPTPNRFAYLKARRFRTVINLRAENEEKALVRSLTMRWLYRGLKSQLCEFAARRTVGASSAAEILTCQGKVESSGS